MQSSARIDELRQKFHENPRRYFAPLANEYRKAGDPEQAIAICRAHLAQQPAHMSGHVVYAQALYDAGRIDESRVVFEKALSLDPDNAIVLRQLGDISRQKGDSSEARHWYTRALDADPHDREIAAYIAELTEPLTESEPEVPPPAPAEPAQVAAPEASVDTVEKTPEAETPEATTEPEPAAEVAAEVAAEPEPAMEAEEVPSAPVEEVIPEPLEEIEPAPVEEVSTEPLEEIEPAPLEEVSAEPDVEVEIPTSEEPPALTDIPGFEADEALFAADEDVELFPDSSSPFVTRTMADLYAKQGYNDQALEVYRKLAADNPHDQEIADRIRELSPADSAPPAEPVAEEMIAASAPTQPADEIEEPLARNESSDNPVHFTDTELGGDEWDISSWGAGFSNDETETASLEDDSLATGDAEALEPVATDEREIAAASKPDVIEDEPPVRHRADATLIAETDRTGEFAPPTHPVGVFNDTRDESHEELYRPSDQPLPTEPSVEIHVAPEPVTEEPVEREATVPAEPEGEDAWRPEDAVDAEVESEHFVAYSPQPPEDDDLPHYTPVGPTIREFFATLGAYRPPENGAASFTARAAVPDIDVEAPSYDSTIEVESDYSSEPAPESQQPDEFPLVTDALANLFPDSPVSEEDSKAAFALSGALSSQPAQPVSRPYATPPAPAPAIEEPPQPTATEESEDDIRRFREWLDGLAES